MTNIYSVLTLCMRLPGLPHEVGIISEAYFTDEKWRWREIKKLNQSWAGS